MTQVTILRPPSDFVVMAHAAELSFDDVGHEYVVGSRTHFETDFSVTHPAAKTDAMEPVREDHRAHARFFRPLVKHHVAVFSPGGRRGSKHEECQNYHNSRQITMS